MIGVRMMGALRGLGRQGRAIIRRVTWVRPPVECSSLRAIASDAGGRTVVRHEAREQRYALPAAAEDVLGFFRASEARAMPEEVCCTVPGGRIVGLGAVLSPDGQKIARDVSVVFGGTDGDHPMLHVDRIPPPRRLRGRTLNVASEGGDSYYHWLLDELPRFLEAAHDGHDAVIGSRGHLARVAEMVGFTGRLVDAGRQHHFRCDELSVASLFGRTGNPTPEVAALLRDFAQRHALCAEPGGRPRRIFISRSVARVRRLVHEQEIWSQLESRGFERLVLERMAWEEQIKAFSAAEIVVAPHGAGLANLVFCRPGTRVIELFDRRYLHWCYWQLAAVSGLEYHAVVSEGNASPVHDFGNVGTDIDVRWERFQSLV